MRNTLTLFLLVLLSTPAMAIYKCESGGNISYSDAPCGNGKQIKLQSRLDSGPSERDIVDARRKAAQDKAQLERLESERSRQDAKEEKSRAKLARAETSKRMKCAEMALQKKWADQDASASAGKSAEKAKRNALRKTEQFELACGK